MDFARKQMEKYGWKEGQGLGKNESGITNALKPKLKNNNNGLGFDISEEFTNNWWDTLYKKASDNIAVTETSGEVKLFQVRPDSVEISNSEYKINKKGKKGVDQSFVKTSKIIQGSTIDFGTVLPERNEIKIPILTDEELFKACGGRTAHKGARHGLNLSGKLARIEKHEKILLKQMRRISLNEENDVKVEKKCKKLEKLKISDKLDKKDDEKLSKKKKKKKRKSVSFSNAIAEVIPDAEADSSFNSDDRLGYDSSSTSDLRNSNFLYPHSFRSRSSSPVSLSSTSSSKPKTSRSPSPSASLPSPPPSTSNTLPDEGIEQDFPPQDNNFASTSKQNRDDSILNDNSSTGNTGTLSAVKQSKHSKSVKKTSDLFDKNDHRSFEERSDGAKVGNVAKSLGNLDALLSKAEKKLMMRKMRATERFLADTLVVDVPHPESFSTRNELQLERLKTLRDSLKRKTEKIDDTDDIEIDNKNCNSCYKKSKKERKQEKVVNKIAKGLEKVCKISDTNEDKIKDKKKAEK